MGRLQELIREEVNFLLRSEIGNPRLDGIVVTMVELAGDGSCARIWFTAETDDDRIDALEGAAGFLRSRLAESLDCKRTPELRFRRDPVIQVFARPTKEMM
jgi:ribosome-binding factor A